MISAEDFILKYIGKFSGASASVCFAFVKKVYEDEFGISIKNDYLEMLGKFRVVKEPEFGDIVLMRTHPLVTDHIGVYVRDGRFIHCGKTDEVIVSDVRDSIYGKRVVGFLRYRQG